METRRKNSSKLTLTWLGHSAFRIDTPTGKTILIDPWLDNPWAPADARRWERVDGIFVTHGHADHIGNTVEIARETGARVFAIHEVALCLKKRGVKTAEGLNKSGTVTLDGITATMVNAEHSSGIDDGEVVEAGGEPAGYVFHFENGRSLYHAGDTGVFMDMKLIGTLYHPHIAILPIGGLFTMSPKEAAVACRLLNPAVIIGMHYGTFPPLAGTPAELRRLLPSSMKKRLLELQPGVSVLV